MYTNTWYIDPKELDKDADERSVVTLYFLPPSLFYSWLFISGMPLIGCVEYLFILRLAKLSTNYPSK